MQTIQPRAMVPLHPNIVELAALLEDDRLKAEQRHRLERALRDVLCRPDTGAPDVLSRHDLMIAAA